MGEDCFRKKLVLFFIASLVLNLPSIYAGSSQSCPGDSFLSENYDDFWDSVIQYEVKKEEIGNCPETTEEYVLLYNEKVEEESGKYRSKLDITAAISDKSVKADADKELKYKCEPGKKWEKYTFHLKHNVDPNHLSKLKMLIYLSKIEHDPKGWYFFPYKKKDDTPNQIDKGYYTKISHTKTTLEDISSSCSDFNSETPPVYVDEINLMPAVETMVEWGWVLPETHIRLSVGSYGGNTKSESKIKINILELYFECKSGYTKCGDDNGNLNCFKDSDGYCCNNLWTQGSGCCDDSDCEDKNPCTNDNCNNNKCVYSKGSDGKTTGGICCSGIFYFGGNCCQDTDCNSNQVCQDNLCICKDGDTSESCCTSLGGLWIEEKCCGDDGKKDDWCGTNYRCLNGILFEQCQGSLDSCNCVAGDCTQCANDAFCTASCVSCDTTCNGICQHAVCFGIDPDCNTAGDTQRCCGNSACEADETPCTCSQDCGDPGLDYCCESRDCNDNNQCTEDVCNYYTHQCQHTNLDDKDYGNYWCCNGTVVADTGNICCSDINCATGKKCNLDAFTCSNNCGSDYIECNGKCEDEKTGICCENTWMTNKNCCIDDSCELNQTCTDNLCANLECPECMHPENHACANNTDGVCCDNSWFEGGDCCDNSQCSGLFTCNSTLKACKCEDTPSEPCTTLSLDNNTVCSLIPVVPCCGNFLCEEDEHANNCADDCPIECGDTICSEQSESVNVCPDDCCSTLLERECQGESLCRWDSSGECVKKIVQNRTIDENITVSASPTPEPITPTINVSASPGVTKLPNNDPDTNITATISHTIIVSPTENMSSLSHSQSAITPTSTETITIPAIPTIIEIPKKPTVVPTITKEPGTMNFFDTDQISQDDKMEVTLAPLPTIQILKEKCVCKDDANPCTEDICENDQCVHKALVCGTPCGSQSVCNGQGLCNERVEENSLCICPAMCAEGLTCTEQSTCEKTVCGDGKCEGSECRTCQADCNKDVCNGNGFCDLSYEETCSSAPSDCICPTGHICNPTRETATAHGCYLVQCGDFSCDLPFETAISCCKDCGCPKDYYCDESIQSCTSLCGNTECNEDECSTCPTDCSCNQCKCSMEIDIVDSVSGEAESEEKALLSIRNTGDIDDAYSVILEIEGKKQRGKSNIMVAAGTSEQIFIPITILKKPSDIVVNVHGLRNDKSITKTISVIPVKKSFLARFRFLADMKDIAEILFLIFSILFAVLFAKRKREEEEEDDDNEEGDTKNVVSGTQQQYRYGQRANWQSNFPQERYNQWQQYRI